MFVLEGDKLVVNLVGAVLVSVALSMDKLKERVLCRWKAGPRTREADALIV